MAELEAHYPAPDIAARILAAKRQRAAQSRGRPGPARPGCLPQVAARGHLPAEVIVIRTERIRSSSEFGARRVWA